MTERNDGGPAFPKHNEHDGGDPGMSLRDWFAGQALAGYLAAHAGAGLSLPRPEKVAADCHILADAMLEARK